jgi:small subunit ribosomal protein S13
MKPEVKQEKDEGLLVRILSTDIPGDKKILAGLIRIKGISWTFSNAVCNALKIDKNKKIKDLTKEEIEKISGFVARPKLPDFILNRRKDIETGESKHLIGSDLILQREFDIKRLKKMKCYRGLRHSQGQPVRGQKTRSHFRSNKSVGVTKKRVTGKK